MISCVTLAALVLGTSLVKAGSDSHDANRRHADLAKKQEASQGYMNVGYYANWVLYQDYSVSSIPVDRYTHLLYSFANMTAEGTVFLSDPWADTQFVYPGDSTAEGDLGGSLKQFYLLKKTHRNLKTMISVGGWTYRHAFASLPDAAWRAEFVRSSVKLVVDLGLDGIDIDYEWADAKTKEGTADLMVELRKGLDDAAAQIGASKLLLSYAAPCGSAWNFLDIPKMDASIDFWNLMAYEYAGGFAALTKPTANLLPDEDPKSSTYSGKRCVDYFLDHGATARKLNLGMPLYGTGWNGTEGMYSNWTSRGSGSDSTPGFYHNYDLPVAGEVTYSEALGASWTLNAADGHLVSFDIPRVALQKTKYVIDNGLGGLMWWAVDEDWVEAAPEPQQAAKRHLERKKGKRSCKRPATPSVDIGYVHAADPLASNSTSAASAGTLPSVSTSIESVSSVSASVSASESGSTSTSASGSALESASASEPASTSAIASSASSSSAPLPSSSSTSEAEGEQDGIQLDIGRSLVQVAKEGFEKYAQGLDKSENVLGYSTSEYGNVRSGM